MSTYLLAAAVVALFLVLLAVQAYRIVQGYRAATGTPWQRFLAAFSHSHTILLTRAVSFLAAFAGVLQSWLPVLDPSTQLGAAVTALFDPKFAPWYLCGLMLLTEWVRRRQSSIDPVLPPPQAVVIPPAPIISDLAKV